MTPLDGSTRKGWYIIPGVQDGDRTVEEQLTGLRTIQNEARGCTVLDFGCAEALISRHLVAHCGALSSVGFSHVPAEIEVGRRACEGLPITLHALDLNDFRPWRAVNPLAPRYDIVLLLSILHKLKDPLGFLGLALEHAGDWVAVRLPSPVIQDYRSGGRVFRVRPVLRASFDLVEEPAGPRGEWCSLWRRRK